MSFLDSVSSRSDVRSLAIRVRELGFREALGLREYYLRAAGSRAGQLDGYAQND